MKSIIEEKSYKDTVLKSKFFSYIFKCESAEKQIEILKEIKKEHLSASHICYASIFEGEQHSNDDGEPSKTAGGMILSALKDNNVINVLCVVVRYFGGIKLGVNRLARVYKNCAKECIFENIRTIEKQTLFSGKCNYNTFDIVKNFLVKNNIILENVCFKNEVEFEVFLSEQKFEELCKITDLKSKDIYKIV